MRPLAAFLLLLAATLVHAERILLIPLDSRPAAGQFAQMIAKTAGIDVELPPMELLGRFTVPGQPDRILDWLEREDLSDVSAVIASTDMVCYGGLIESRVGTVPMSLALQRARRLSRVVRAAPHVRLYAFAATMRLYPTATRQSGPFRLVLAKYEEAKAKGKILGDESARRLAERLEPTLPKREIEAYEKTRLRNVYVQSALLRMVADKALDYLVMGQDDARPFGPHVAENAALARRAAALGLGAESVFFCEGIDQHANVLVSRALLAQAGWTPVVRVVASDDDGLERYASYESKPLRDSLQDQLLASGARPAAPGDEYDYTLYLNTPKRREDRFAAFLTALKEDVDQGFPVAVADINFAGDGTADPELFAGLQERARMMRLLAFAGWNTAGNTMGTAIPAANVYLLARRLRVDPLVREVAQKEFLLHRFVNDVAYHKLTRPAAYAMIREGGGSVEEAYGEPFARMEAFVQRDLRTHLIETFNENFLGRRFFAGTKGYVFSGITDISISLPWPRAYEARLTFHLEATPVP